MTKLPSERWKLSSRNMEQLLSDVASHKGESLWQDAWRRLKRNRAAFWSLVFLGLFALVSLCAPLLPLASPKSLALQTEPQAPSWPWQSPTHTDAETQPGFAITDSFGGMFDNGWRHRTVLQFTGIEGLADEGIRQLSELVGEVADRTPALDRRTSNKGTSLYVALPFEVDDKPRTDWAATGQSGDAIVRLFGKSAAWLTLNVPVDETSFTGWRIDASGTSVALTLEDEAGTKQRYALTSPRQVAAPFVGLTLNGRHLPSEGNVDTTASPDGIGAAEVRAPSFELFAKIEGAEYGLGELGDDHGDMQLTQVVNGKTERLASRDHARYAEELGTPHRDLAMRVAAALADSPLAAKGVALGETTFEDGYWELGWLDRQLLAARAGIFGLWQTGNWMGTDSKGRDIFARIVWGSRTSIIVAVIATLCSLLIGVTYGAFSGLMGGRIDNLMMRVVDILYSLPFIFVVIFLITIINANRTVLEDQFGIDREVTFFFVIGAIYWLTMARVVRGQVLSLKNSEFIEAARVIGASTPRILFAHIVPNVLSIVIVYLTLTIPSVMLFEAFLSFLGLGIEPPKVSWGILAVDGTEAINSIQIYWWLVVFPALAMGSALLALNVLGDGLRDALDPKLRGKD